MGISLKGFKKARKAFKRTAQTLTGTRKEIVGAIKTAGAELTGEAKKQREKSREAERAAALQRTQEEAQAALERRRKPLRLRGARSTRAGRISPDIFASSLGAPKTLLGQ